ncbi:MAG: hypothetical protein ACK2T3_15245, partial [Candidatus Promineifilaceae bacterium]
FAPSLVFREIAEQIPQYAGMDYRTLAWTEEQWPIVGDEDAYYGGNSYENKSGLGLQWPVAAEGGEVAEIPLPEIAEPETEQLTLVPVRSLFDQGQLIEKSEVLSSRVAKRIVYLNSEDAKSLGVHDGDVVPFDYYGVIIEAEVTVSDLSPRRVALMRGYSDLNRTIKAEHVKEMSG